MKLRVLFALFLVLLCGRGFAADEQELRVTKVVEDDTALPGGQVFRMLAEDATSTYELACSRKNGTSTPSLDKRLFEGVPKSQLPEDTLCGPFTVGQTYSVMFHQGDAKYSHMTGRLVTFMVEEAKPHRMTRMVVFKVERVESKPQ
jgi:hypothetical protein